MHYPKSITTGLILAASVYAVPASACGGHGHNHGANGGFSVSTENCVKVYRGMPGELDYDAIYKMETIRLGEEKLKAETAHRLRMEAQAARQTSIISALANRPSPVYYGSAQRRYYTVSSYNGRRGFRPRHSSGYAHAASGDQFTSSAKNHHSAGARKSPVYRSSSSGSHSSSHGGGKKGHH